MIYRLKVCRQKFASVRVSQTKTINRNEKDRQLYSVTVSVSKCACIHSKVCISYTSCVGHCLQLSYILKKKLSDLRNTRSLRVQKNLETVWSSPQRKSTQAVTWVVIPKYITLWASGNPQYFTLPCWKPVMIMMMKSCWSSRIKKLGIQN